MSSANLNSKIIERESLAAWRKDIRANGRKLVVTNGCFDLIHLGHVMYLEAARNLADVLLVGINTDASVRQLKGSGRPINSESERAAVVAALQSVDSVCLFSEPTALRFLAEAEPDVWVKGGDYTRGSLDQDECRVVEQAGGRILILPFIPGKSTTVLLRRISCRDNPSQRGF